VYTKDAFEKELLEAKNAVQSAQKVIVVSHAGIPHADDILALTIAKASGAETARIEDQKLEDFVRQKVQEGYVVLVMDVGANKYEALKAIDPERVYVVDHHGDRAIQRATASAAAEVFGASLPDHVLKFVDMTDIGRFADVRDIAERQLYGNSFLTRFNAEPKTKEEAQALLKALAEVTPEDKLAAMKIVAKKVEHIDPKLLETVMPEVAIIKYYLEGDAAKVRELVEKYRLSGAGLSPLDFAYYKLKGPVEFEKAVERGLADTIKTLQLVQEGKYEKVGTVSGVDIYLIDEAVPATAALRAILAREGSSRPAVLTSKSLRGGYNITRLDEHKDAINLSKLEGLPHVTFAHKGGFIAVIDGKDGREAAEIAKQLIPHAVVRGPSVKI